jgi:hypothetical protein
VVRYRLSPCRAYLFMNLGQLLPALRDIIYIARVLKRKIIWSTIGKRCIYAGTLPAACTPGFFSCTVLPAQMKDFIAFCVGLFKNLTLPRPNFA